MKRVLIGGAILATVGMSACGSSSTTASPPATPTAPAASATTTPSSVPTVPAPSTTVVVSAAQTYRQLKVEIVKAFPHGCWTGSEGPSTGGGWYDSYSYFTTSVRTVNGNGNNTPDPSGTGCSGEYAGTESDEVDVALYSSVGAARQGAISEVQGLAPTNYEAVYLDGATMVTVPLSSSPATVAAVRTVAGLKVIWTHS
jgi:ABC-type Fe3+-hydroxamate transport system substrate-binding protein